MLISLCQFVANKIVLHRFSNLTSHKLSKVVDTLFFLTEYIVEKATVQVIELKQKNNEYVKTQYSIEFHVLF